MRLAFTRLNSLFPHGHFVQWTLRDAHASGTYAFAVYRSGGRDGPWELLAAGLTDAYAYVDRFAPSPAATPDRVAPNQLALFRNFYYRVEARAPSGEVLSAVEEVGPLLGVPGGEGQPLVYRKLGQYHRKARRDVRLALKLTGTPAAFLKRRAWGERCPRCFDKVAREVVRAACTTCWGTGFVGGYWAPTLLWARRGTGQSSTQVTPEQTSDANDTKIYLPDMPGMERDDVVVFLDDDRRFRIEEQAQTEIKLAAVHQLLAAKEVPRDHVLYRLPVHPGQLRPLY